MTTDDRVITRTQVWKAAVSLADGDPDADDGTYAFEDYVAMVRQIAEDFGLMTEDLP